MARSASAKSVAHSVSCTPFEWEQIRERARAEGKPISRYLVQRALTMEPGVQQPKTGDPPQLVLSEDEQRQLFRTVSQFAGLMSEEMFFSGRGSTNLPRRVRILFEMKLDEMTRTGRYEAMKKLLSQVLKDERTSRIGMKAYERNRPGVR